MGRNNPDFHGARERAALFISDSSGTTSINLKEDKRRKDEDVEFEKKRQKAQADIVRKKLKGMGSK
jgi:hypothetical protein